MERTNANVIAETLSQSGIKVVYGVSGGFILPLFQAIGQTKGIEIVAPRNEQGASFMADAYARVTGICGCCISTSGPGATNLLTGVAGAYADSLPLLVITGQVSTEEMGHGGIQEASGVIRSPYLCNIYQSVTKWNYRLKRSDNVGECILRAIEIATTGRTGPVHIEIPLDIMTALPNSDSEISTDYESLSNSVESDFISLQLSSSSEVERAVNIITAAKHPVILAGAGVYRSGSSKLLREVQDRLCIPVATSLGGRGVVDESHELSLGMIGCYGQDVSNDYTLNYSDVVLAIGVSFQYLTSISWNNKWNSKKLIHIDIDNRELTKNFNPEVALHGSLKFFLERLYQENILQAEVRAKRIHKLNQAKKKHGFFPSNRVKESGGNRQGFCNPTDVGVELSKKLKKNDYVVLDSGENAYWSMLSIKIGTSGQLISNNAWGSMGYAVAAPVGVYTALQNSSVGRVYGILGDGGLMMNLPELTVGVQYKTRCTWILLDNQGYGTQKHWQRDWYDSNYVGTEMPEIDFSALSTSFGMKAFEVTDKKSLILALDSVEQVEEDFPCTLIWVHIDPEVKPPQSYGSTLKK